MKDVNCPYCDAEQDIDHDDGYGYEEDELHEQYCNGCEKTFVYRTSISYYYEADKADCLNDGEHTYEPTHTYPKEATRMECTQCDDRRNPTEKEKKTIMEEK